MLDFFVVPPMRISIGLIRGLWGLLLIPLCISQEILVAPSTLGIGINAPDPSAIVDIASTTQGILPPVVTTVEKYAITPVAPGLGVADSTVSAFSTYNSTTGEWTNYGYQPTLNLTVQVFTTNGTWVPPSGTILSVRVLCIGGGAGGQSGYRVYNPTLLPGGAGGGAGALSILNIVGSDISGNVSVLVGQGGLGGVANISGSTANIGAVQGTNGQASSFGNFVSCPGGTSGINGFTGGSGINIATVPATNGIGTYDNIIPLVGNSSNWLLPTAGGDGGPALYGEGTLVNGSYPFNGTAGLSINPIAGGSSSPGGAINGGNGTSNNLAPVALTLLAGTGGGGSLGKAFPNQASTAYPGGNGGLYGGGGGGGGSVCCSINYAYPQELCGNGGNGAQGVVHVTTLVMY